ncbi:MAG: response regulator [Flavobacteriaceae bacterium]|nr:response regulator [Flavobacteriaceae bacterium]
MKKKILIIEDDNSIRRVVKDILQKENLYEVYEAFDGKDGVKKIIDTKFNLILCDIKMPKMDGMEVLKKVNHKKISVPFIMLTGHGNVETAVSAMKLGAFDFIQKPPDLNRLLVSVRSALKSKNIDKKPKKTQSKISEKFKLIGSSKKIKYINDLIDKVAKTNARVLITGQSGTGKEIVANQLHYKSFRSNHSFIEVNCAAIPSELIESELFGHIKGSFTSAVSDKKGKFELADSGTLFLDEIADLSLKAQAKVLRALQENKITRVGGSKDIKVDARVICATNKDLKVEISKGNFREDLYHRLAVIEIKLPSLSERIDDIKELTTYFLDKISIENNVNEKKITDSAINQLKKNNWKGNVRELRNVIERLTILGDDPISLNNIKKLI